jgi:hypothetical protein
MIKTADRVLGVDGFVMQFWAVGRRLLRVSSVHFEFVSVSFWTSWVKGKAKE